MPPRKKSTGQMPPRKSPGKKLPAYNGFWKRIPLENAFEQNTLERFLLGKCPKGTKSPRNISFNEKMPVGKIPTRKKGLLKIPLQNILSTHGKKPRRKLPPRKSALKMPF